MIHTLPIYRLERAFLTRGLDAWHDFKTGLPVLADLSSNNRHGTLQNTPLSVNGGLNFVAASTQYVSRSDSAPATVHVIFVARIASAAATMTLAGRWGNSNATRGWIAQVNTSRQLVTGKSNGAATATVNTTATATTGAWFIAEVITNGTSSMMARLGGTGAYSTSASVAGATNTGGAFGMARNEDGGGTQYWDGDIAYMLQYQRQLSEDEIAATVQALRALLSIRGIVI